MHRIQKETEHGVMRADVQLVLQRHTAHPFREMVVVGVVVVGGWVILASFCCQKFSNTSKNISLFYCLSQG